MHGTCNALFAFCGEQKETAEPFPISKPVRTRGRGARRRRKKGLRGAKHHARLEEGRFGPGGVVPVDEGTRVCGERSTTPDWRKAGSDPGAWCPSTKEQGFEGREAPRRADGRPVRARGRGARRRRNKGLREVKHHAEPARSAAGWHQKAELLQQLRDIIILSDENRDLISKNPSRIGLVREIHEGVLFGIVGDGSV